MVGVPLSRIALPIVKLDCNLSALVLDNSRNLKVNVSLVYAVQVLMPTTHSYRWRRKHCRNINLCRVCCLNTPTNMNTHSYGESIFGSKARKQEILLEGRFTTQSLPCHKPNHHSYLQVNCSLMVPAWKICILLYKQKFKLLHKFQICRQSIEWLKSWLWLHSPNNSSSRVNQSLLGMWPWSSSTLSSVVSETSISFRGTC